MDSIGRGIELVGLFVLEVFFGYFEVYLRSFLLGFGGFFEKVGCFIFVFRFGRGLIVGGYLRLS